MARKPRTDEQKERRRLRDRERAEEVSQARGPVATERPPIPALKVQRMGKLFRIAYKETRNLAKFNSGEPVDGGGFDNQVDAEIGLVRILSEQGPTTDAEAETVG